MFSGAIPTTFYECFENQGNGVDFRRKHKRVLLPLVTNDLSVEMVDCFKFLGTHILSDFTWEENTKVIVKKAHARLHLLRRLKSFRVSSNLLFNFYRSFVESILLSSITVWYGSISAKDRKCLDRAVRTASRIVGKALPLLETLYYSRIRRKTLSIMSDPSHPASDLFDLLRSGDRLRSIPTRTERLKRTFYPTAVQLFNDDTPRRRKPNSYVCNFYILHWLNKTIYLH